MPRRPKIAEPGPKNPEPGPKKVKGQRTTVCEHRVPPEAYCKRGCDG